MKTYLMILPDGSIAQSMDVQDHIVPVPMDGITIIEWPFPIPDPYNWRYEDGGLIPYVAPKVELTEEQKWARLRRERNELLQQSDVEVIQALEKLLPESPLKTYRENLRKFPNQGIKADEAKIPTLPLAASPKAKAK